MNFWSYILDGLLFVIQTILIPIFGGTGNYHAAMGLGGKMVYNAKVIFEVLFIALGNFDMTLVGIAIALTIPMFIILVALKIWMTIKNAIPVIG